LIEGFLRRLLAIFFGFLVAASAGALFLPLAALADPLLREAGFDAMIVGFFSVLDETAQDGDPASRLFAFGFVFWTILIAVCAAPLAFVALIGEIAGARGWSWYVFADGLLAAASPWIVRGARGGVGANPPTPLELRIIALLFLTGALTGAVYWLISVRGERAGGQ
jgi:hypothetical protein